jgi:hypothetical protein
MGKYKGFTDGTEERIELFSIYSDLDEEIIEKASENDLYLIGGTAIEIWLNHLGLKGWRKRSNNDFDLVINKASQKQRKNFEEFLINEKFKENIKYKAKNHSRFEYREIIIDLINYGIGKENFLNPNMYKLIDPIKSKFKLFKIKDSIKIMSPEILFTSKYERVWKLYLNKTRKDRYKKDLKDLKDLFLIVRKLRLENKLEEELEYLYGQDLNEVEEFINKELK